MAVSGAEIIRRHVDNNGASRGYYLHEAEDEDGVAAWMDANVPSHVAGFPLADFNADEIEEIPGDFELTVNWGLPQYAGSPQDNETVEYKFNFQAPSGLIKQSLETIAAYTDPSLGFSVDKDNFGGAINVVNDGGKYRVEGQQFSPPPESFVLSYRTGFISGAYQSLVRSMQGKVNSTLYRGEPAGSLMLVRTSGGRDTSGIWYIEFGWGNIENDTNIQVGEISVPQKDGMDLLWTFYGNRPNATANGIAPTPQYVFIERIFKRANFNLLNLPA